MEVAVLSHNFSSKTDKKPGGQTEKLTNLQTQPKSQANIKVVTRVRMLVYLVGRALGKGDFGVDLFAIQQVVLMIDNL